MKKTGYLLLASIIMLGSLFLPGVVVYAFNPDTPLSGADASFLGENQNDYSGYSVAPAGDVNGDGYDDLLIGAYRHNNYTGKTYLILGKDPPNWGSGFNLAAADASFLGENQDDYSGHAVASAGDINNDGYDDFLIGAYWKDTENGGLSGKAYLILGKNTPDWGNNYSLANADASYLGEDGSDHAGCSVSIAGDVNNDGYDDFLIGAYQNDAGGSWKGKAYLILGSNDPNKWQTNLNLSGADAAFCGENNFDYAGCAVSTAGDVNGDDYDDFLIGAWGNSEVQDDAGETYLILGKDTPDWGNNYPLSNAQASFRGEAEDDRSGSSVATAGDVNGDGYDDCLIGAYWNDYSASSAGQAYLVLGESTPGWGMNFALSGADASFVGETSYDYAGFSIATAGDINSDGFDDFLIGAYSANGSSIGAGKTYLMMGNTETNWGRHFALSGADASFLGEELNDESGISVASAGDVNNDGFPDLLIGANRYDDDENEIDNIGKTYLLLGRAAPGITVSDISGDTTEAGGTATFTIVLNTEPSADVTIDLSSDDTTEGTVLPTSVTFTSGNSDSPQTVTVTGVDDYIDDGDIIYNIITAAATSEDTNYDDLDADDVAVTNTDDDTAGITVSTISGNTTEAGGTADFTIVLDSQPTANVTIGLSSDDTSEGTVSPTSVTFTSANWDIAQTVTVTGVDDVIDDGDIAYSIITAAASSTDAKYNNMDADNVAVTNIDDDTAGITVSTISGNTTEAGGTATFTIVLDSQPTANVTIGLSSDDTSEGTVSPTSVTFTSANWDIAQTVTVTGVDDVIDDGDIVYNIITAAASSTDAKYNNMDANNVAVTNTDDDGPGITVSAISGNTTEAGGTATFTIVLDTPPADGSTIILDILDSKPNSGVTIGLSSDDTTEGTVSPTSVAFTSANWDTPQTVTVTGVDDDIDDGDIEYNIITAPAVSSDNDYNNLDAANVAVTNIDDDTAGITVSAISGNTAELGDTATFTIVLNSQPAADVTIPLSCNDTTEGTISPSSVTFTPCNWNTPQTVTVTGIDDDLQDGNIAYSIITGPVVSSDPVYNNMDADNVAVTNIDDEEAKLPAGVGGEVYPVNKTGLTVILIIPSIFIAAAVVFLAGRKRLELK